MRLLASALAISLLWASFASAQSADPAAGAAEEKLAACAPKTLDQALSCLDSSLHGPVKEALLAKRYDQMIEYHFGLGMWIRNNWGLWRGGDLRADMNRAGLSHPDDMSMWIIRLFWLEQHGCEKARDQQAAYRTAFEAEAAQSAASSPNGMMRMEDIKVQAPHLDCTTSSEAIAQ